MKLRNYVTLQGRVGRRAFLLANGLCAAGLGLMVVSAEWTDAWPAFAALPWLALVVLALIVILLVSISYAVRRLHDLDLSGRWLILWGFALVAIVKFVLGIPIDDPFELVGVWRLTWPMLWLMFVLWLGTTKGLPIDNRFGEALRPMA